MTALTSLPLLRWATCMTALPRRCEDPDAEELDDRTEVLLRLLLEMMRLRCKARLGAEAWDLIMDMRDP